MGIAYYLRKFRKKLSQISASGIEGILILLHGFLPDFMEPFFLVERSVE